MTRAILSYAASGVHSSQRGMVTLVVMLFLIATVVFALSQMLGVSSGNVIDGQRQGDSAAAFFVAESGLEKAHAGVNAALGGTFTNASCTGVAANYNLGRGSVSVTAESTPQACNGNCEKCSVRSTGQVGFTTRTLTQDLVLIDTNGVFCNAANGCSNNPVTWQLKLKNTAAVAGIGVFNLTYQQQGNNHVTANSAVACAIPANCPLQLDVHTPNNGTNSVGLMGNAVLIPANTTYPVYQTMFKADKSLVEVGAFFLGTSAPTLTAATAGAASYWGNSTVSADNNTTTGSTNDGTHDPAVAGHDTSCDQPSANAQSCTTWCTGGDTLVYSFGANVTQLTDELSSVTFATNGQNIAMTRLAKYPTPLISGAPTNVDAEIWYARNPNFTGVSPLALNASSFKGRGTGAVGARWASNNNGEGTSITFDSTLNVYKLTVGNSFTGYPNQIISVDDTISNTGGSGAQNCTTNCGTITSQLTSNEAGGMATGRGGRGTYEISGTQTVASAKDRQWTISSSVLHVLAGCTICNFAGGDSWGTTGATVLGTISSQASIPTGYNITTTTGGSGLYNLSLTTFVATGTNVYAGSAAVFAGTPGATIYLPSTSSQPSVTTPAMLVTKKSGTGSLPFGTTVTATSAVNAATTAFTVSPAPTSSLDGASLCAGTCAFFVPNSTTNFSLGGFTNNFAGWASGFMCLKGVDLPPNVVTSTSPFSRRWTEVIQ